MQDKIAQAQTMQLATVRNGQPWICTVYFVLHAGNFYWLSFPTRRHSEELAANPNAAIAIALKTDVPVVGMQAEGDVRVVEDAAEVKVVLDLYVEKYGQGARFAERFERGENQHELYRFTPRTVMMFDEYTTPDASYRKILLTQEEL